MILSSWATTTAEDTIAAGKEIPVENPSSGLPLYWFQLYVYKDRAMTESLVRRVEKVGYKGTDTIASHWFVLKRTIESCSGHVPGMFDPYPTYDMDLKIAPVRTPTRYDTDGPPLIPDLDTMNLLSPMI